MEQLISRAVELFEEPFDDREGRDEDLPSVRFVAGEMDSEAGRICFRTEENRRFWCQLSVSDVSAVWDYSADTDGIVGNSAPESNEGATGDANPKWA